MQGGQMWNIYKEKRKSFPKEECRSTEFRVAGCENNYEIALSPVSAKSLEIFVRSVKRTALYFRDSHPKWEWIQDTKLAARWANNNLYLIVQVEVSGLKEQKERKEPWHQFKDTFLTLVLHSQSITKSSDLTPEISVKSYSTSLLPSSLAPAPT